MASFYPMHKEEGLIKRAKNGDAASFGELYDKHLPAIYRYIFLKVTHKQIAEDLTHEVFLSAWQNIKNYKLQGFPFSSWLYRIAHNAVVDHYRTDKALVSLDAIAEELPTKTELAEAIDVSIDTEQVQKALLVLKPDEQNILILKFVNDLSNKEIAQALGKSEVAVRVTQHRALKNLRSVLAKQHQDINHG